MKFLERYSLSYPKLFKSIARGITGKDYTKLKDIPKNEQDEIEAFIKKNEKEKYDN